MMLQEYKLLKINITVYTHSKVRLLRKMGEYYLLKHFWGRGAFSSI